MLASKDFQITFCKQVLCLFTVKEDTVAKEKTEKNETLPTTDFLNTTVKSNKPENTEKTDNKKVDNMNKIQGMEKQDFKTENEQLKTVSNVEETKKEMMHENKNGGEKVDKTVKNEKNVKAAKETSKPTAANGSKDLISPDKVKVRLVEKGHKPSYTSLCGCVQIFNGMTIFKLFIFRIYYPVKRVFDTKILFSFTMFTYEYNMQHVQSSKQNAAKPSSNSTGENSGALTSSSANKKGPATKKTSPTGTKKPPGFTSTHEAKVSKHL